MAFRTVALVLASATFLPGQTFELEGGTTELTLSSGFVQAAGQLGVSLLPNSPATADGGVVSFPVSGGALDSLNARGEIAHRGGLTLLRGVTRVDLLEPLVDTKGFVPSLSLLSVKNEGVFDRVRFFDLQPKGLLPLPLAPVNGVLTLSNVDVRLTLEGAIALNLALGSNAFSPGFLLGNLTTTLTTQLDFLSQFEVDPERYDGLWHEYARTPNSFEDNTPVIDGEEFSACYNSTAEYAIAAPDRIELTNRCEREGEFGTVSEESISGAALIEPNSGNRKLKVAFGGELAQLFQRLFTGGGSPYWIFCLDPAEGPAEYEWAVVSDSARFGIFVLTRDKTISPELEEEILGCAEAQGLRVEDLIFRQQ